VVTATGGKVVCNKGLSILVAVVFVAGAFGISASAEDPSYIGPNQCKVCHNKKSDGEQYNKWKAMSHAKAFETLKSEEAKAVAAKAGVEGPPEKAPACLKCHVTAYDVEKKAQPEKLKLEEGVSCEMCHGPASAHRDAGKKVMFQKATDVNPGDFVQKATAKLCTECHSSDSPTFKPEKYTLEDGTKTGFDFEQALKKIDHKRPEKEE
jgi:cytochrome c554/c'-like protein